MLDLTIVRADSQPVRWARSEDDFEDESCGIFESVITHRLTGQDRTAALAASRCGSMSCQSVTQALLQLLPLRDPALLLSCAHESQCAGHVPQPGLGKASGGGVCRTRSRVSNGNVRLGSAGHLAHRTAFCTDC